MMESDGREGGGSGGSGGGGGGGRLYLKDKGDSHRHARFGEGPVICSRRDDANLLRDRPTMPVRMKLGSRYAYDTIRLGGNNVHHSIQG